MNESMDELLATPDKVYIRVNEDRMPDGSLLLNHFYWEDGQICYITKVTDIRPSHSVKAGGFGTRYTVEFTVEGNLRVYTKYMFLEVDRWFMERKKR